MIGALVAAFLIVCLIALASERDGPGWDSVLFLLVLIGVVAKRKESDDD